jgi:hypothetical protein
VPHLLPYPSLFLRIPGDSRLGFLGLLRRRHSDYLNYFLSPTPAGVKNIYIYIITAI